MTDSDSNDTQEVVVTATLVLNVESGESIEDAVRAYMADNDIAPAFEEVD